MYAFHRIQDLEALIDRYRNSTSSSPNMSCIICELKGKPHNHFLSSCSYLPTADRKFFTKARLVHALDSALEDCDISGDDSNGFEDGSCEYYDEDESVRIGRVRPDLVPIVNRVEVGT